MGNEFGKPEEEEEEYPVIKFLGYATMEEINAEARLDREKLEKEFNRMRKKGQPGPRHPFDICSFCGGNDHYLQDCASRQETFEHAGSEAGSDGPMVCTLCFEFGDHLPENCPNPLDVSNILITRDLDSGPDSTGHGSCPSTLDGNRHDDDTRDIIVGTATGLPTSE